MTNYPDLQIHTESELLCKYHKEMYQNTLKGIEIKTMGLYIDYGIRFCLNQTYFYLSVNPEFFYAIVVIFRHS